MTTARLYPFRQQAKQHVAAAKELLNGSGQHLIYACLELRLAIEALAYDTLQNYADDVGDDLDEAHQHWQPSKVLKHLCEFDPIADMPLRIEMREVAADGAPKEGPPMFIGTDDRFSAKWAETAHGAMGSFLHQRTISHIKKGKSIDEAVPRRKATEVIDRLDPILASEVSNIRLGIRFGYQCPACGADISVAIAPLSLKGKAETACDSCGAEWDVVPGDDPASPRFSRRT